MDDIDAHSSGSARTLAMGLPSMDAILGATESTSGSLYRDDSISRKSLNSSGLRAMVGLPWWRTSIFFTSAIALFT